MFSRTLSFAPALRAPLSRSMSKAFWGNVKMGPKDPILGITEAFKADKNPKKINVGVGAYRDDSGKPWILPSVLEAERRMAAQGLDHEYAPISGLPEYVQEAVNLGYGNSKVVGEKRVAAIQSLSGTGALRLAGDFIWHHTGPDKPTIYLPSPTWGNHFPVFQHPGLKTKEYRYYNDKTLGLDIDGLLQDLATAQPGVVLLHSCAHNPTGVDPTRDQWAQISRVCADAGHFVLMDNAYQGFASGCTETDGWAVRYFIEQGHNIGVCQSFAKNFGLYGERIGLFSIVCASADEAARVESQLKIIARAVYSNPPLHGARIVATVLKDPQLKKQWQADIKTMANRIINMRALLKENIIAAGSKKNWDHIPNQIGMFSYTGLTPAQCDRLTNEFNVYLTRNGRISMAGVTTGNVKALANAIHEVTK